MDRSDKTDPAAGIMSLVIVGHVDHGKSTLIGRLLHDTKTLPEGKIEQVRRLCEKSSRPFEYAFLLDALQDEQSQGITIDTARCFFRSDKRNYILIDAPGHVEFLKNMVSGASRAEAAILVIDALEGVRENSKRHGWLLSFLGIRQIVVAVNKMDLTGYDEAAFRSIVLEYGAFLSRIGMSPPLFIPLSAWEGDNLASPSGSMPWFRGPSLLQCMDSFAKESPPREKPLRLPVQDIYKFTERGDSRRIVAGTIESGTLSSEDRVRFHPSGKEAVVRSIEGFNTPRRESAGPGTAVGITLDSELYLRPGEILSLSSATAPQVSSTFEASIFWLGTAPFLPGERYKLKIHTQRTPVRLEKILRVMDASTLSLAEGKDRIERHDVADCVLKTPRPIAFDLFTDNMQTGRFVIVDGYDIAGGGIIRRAMPEEPTGLEDGLRRREISWTRSAIAGIRRASRFGQTPRFILVTGAEAEVSESVARSLEKKLFDAGKNAYFLSLKGLPEGLDSDMTRYRTDREELIRRLGELARILTDTGLIFLTALPGLDDDETEVLRQLNSPAELFVISLSGRSLQTEGISIVLPAPITREAEETAVRRIGEALSREGIVLEYHI